MAQQKFMQPALDSHNSHKFVAVSATMAMVPHHGWPIYMANFFEPQHSKYSVLRLEAIRSRFFGREMIHLSTYTKN